MLTNTRSVLLDILDELDWKARLGRWPVIAKRWFLGRQAIIRRPAVERNKGIPRSSYVPAFKPYLDREALRPIARVGKQAYTARDIARIFMRELLVEIKQSTGKRLRDIVFTTPVEAYETYRAELLTIGRSLGIKKVRFIDEPVAAALGYGLGLSKERLVLVVDFGAGTLDLALVALSAKGAEEGKAKVIAKEGRALGGNNVNQWILAEICKELDFPLKEVPENEDMAFWYRLMVEEACRVKEEVFFKPSAVFLLTPPSYGRHGPKAGMGECPWLEVTRDRLVEILEQHDLYGRLSECLESILRHVSPSGVSEQDIEEVLMVGGSTLLPGVYPLFERYFGRDRVRAWQPFQSVVYGASVFAAKDFTHSDFIVHDYAFVTYDPKTHKKQYTVIVPRGTHFPTPPEFWKRQLVPTCALGEPETLFKLVVCEIGDGGGKTRKFMWDAQGRLHRLGGDSKGEDQVVVPLNESNPTLGTLDPAHSPRDRKPRLEVSFSVNGDRWLCATVQDLKKRRTLLDKAKVVRLM
ncbi:Hsp70 family protein [Acidobacteriota bacterium]